MSQFYIRQINSPTKILALGHAVGGQYENIPAGFEEAQGELPQGWELIVLPTLSEQLNEVLTLAITANTPLELRAAVRPLRLSVADAVSAGALDEAFYLIDNFPAPIEFAPVKQAMLALLTAAIGE